MMEIVLENLVKIVSAALMMLIGLLGTYLTLKLSKRQELQTINAAQQEAIRLAQQTVEELQQTVVENLKIAHEDGKLTKEEIASLKLLLVGRTKDKLSQTATDLLNAANVDLTKLIIGAGESMIERIKERAVA